MIKNSKIFFKTFLAFYNAVANKEIDDKSIVFIKDREFIYTHGTLFAFPHHIFVTQEQYDSLLEYEKNALYFIVETPLEPLLPQDTVASWTFGDGFPIVFGEKSWTFGSEFPIIF